MRHILRTAPLPDKPILLTFDDGYQDAFTAALPALRARGMRGTFFLVTAWIGPDEAHRSQGEPGRRYLSWPELRALARDAGYRAAVSGKDHGGADRYELYRSGVQGGTSPEKLLGGLH